MQFATLNELDHTVIDYFLPYQKDWINDVSKINVWDKSRRTGGTETAAFKSLLWALETNMPGKDIWFSSADKKAGEEFIIAIKKWAKVFNIAAGTVDEQIIDPESEDKFFLKYEVKIPIEDGMIRVSALSSATNAFHGKQGFIIVDEMARHKDQVGVWEGAFPATIWGYPLTLISTQNGKGLFYQICQDCKKGKVDWGYHRVDIYEAVEQGLYDKIAQGMRLIGPDETTTAEQREKWINDIHKNCRTESVWNQQFLCEAEDEGESFLPYDLIYSCADDSILLEQEFIKVHWNGSEIKKASDHPDNKWIHDQVKDFIEWLNNLQLTGDLYLGVDIGRDHDLTCDWLAEEVGPILITRLVIVLENMPFWVQELVNNALLQHKNMRRSCFDSTGMGRQLAENARLKFGDQRVEEVTFTNKVKEEIAFKMKGRMEDKKFLVPDDRIIFADLHSVKKESTAAGALRLQAAKEYDADGKEIGHADRFWGGGLCNYATDSALGPIKIRTGRKREAKILAGKYLKNG